MTLVDMVRRFGVGAKLKREIMKARGWRQANHITGDIGDWYRNWPSFAPELEAAVKEAKT